MIDNTLLREEFIIIEKRDYQGAEYRYYPTLHVARLDCKHCDFMVRRSDIQSRPGHWVKYGGMRSKMIAHIHAAHADIWARIQKETI